MSTTELTVVSLFQRIMASLENIVTRDMAKFGGALTEAFEVLNAVSITKKTLTRMSKCKHCRDVISHGCEICVSI